MQPVFISKSRSCRKQDTLNQEELHNVRTLVGQLNWLGTQTRPDILFECCTLMRSIKDAKVSDLLNVNKLLSRMKSDQVSIKLFDIGNTDKMKLTAYRDASYANLQDGGSQGGCIIFVTDQNEFRASPIAWQSRKLKRVVKNILAAETLSQVEASETCFWLGSILSEVLCDSLDNIPFIECRTDNHSLAEYTDILQKLS